MAPLEKAKCVVIFSLQLLALMFFIWMAYILAGQKRNTLKLAFIAILIFFFLCFVVHQSRVYVRLYGRLRGFNCPVIEVRDKDHDDVNMNTNSTNMNTNSTTLEVI
jgi:hypothetical protein